MRYRRNEHGGAGRRLLSIVLIYGFFLCLVAVDARAQASMATITGTVTDPQGSVVADAKVSFKNLQTDVTFNTATSSSGVYSATSLNPGKYQVTVTASGFKSSVRDNVTLQVSDRLQLDFKLTVGAVSETVNVTGEAPLLQTGTASLGTVIDENEISSLPVLNANVMTLMQMTVGFVTTGGNTVSNTTPWSTKGGLSNYNVNGSDGFSAQYTLQGSPNTNRENGQMGDHNANDVSIVPPSDAVGEFKTQSNTYDAENGRSAGGSVSISLRSGSNRWHGSLYEYFRNTLFNANTVANKVSGTARSPMHWNQPGGSISGPLIKNKLFFMFTTETDNQHLTNTTQITVPTAAEKAGDFSADGVKIYDPLCTGGRNTEIAGANLANDPCYNPSSASALVAQKLLSYMPEPNIAGASYGSPNRNLDQNVVNLYHTYVGRLDYNLNGNNTFYITYDHDNYTQTGGYQGYSLAAASTASKSYRYNDATTMSWTKVINPTFVSTARISYSRHVTQSVPYAWGYDPSQLGFSGLPSLEFPSIALTWGGSSGAPGPPPASRSGVRSYAAPGPPPGGGAPPGGGGGGQLGNTGLGNTYDSIYTVGETLTKVIKTHSLKLGGEAWLMLDNYNNPSSSSGSFTFDPTFTESLGAVTGQSDGTGDPTASLLLGYPTSASVPVNSAFAYSDNYYSLYLQDDWRVMSKLTLNLGLRWDYESPETERHNKAAIGFDSLTPIMDYQYINNNTHASNWTTLHGGLLYATPSNRVAFHPDWLIVQPRLGLAYQITNKLVFRGGWGLQASATALFPPAGDYNATSTYKASLDNNQTPDVADNTLARPFASINQPMGSSLGLESYYGQSYTFLNPNHKTVTQQNFSAGFEYQLPYKTVISATYVGMRSDNSEPMDSWDINQLPWDTYAYYGTHDDNGNLQIGNNSRNSVLNDVVVNPFYDYIPASSSMKTPTLTNAQMLLPYPQFSGVGISAMNVVKRWYDALQIQATKRASSGLMVMGNLSWSKNEARDHWLNGGHDAFTDLVKEIIPSDRAVIFNLAVNYSEPFFAHSSNQIVKQTLSGWNASTTMSYQSGQPQGSLSGMNWTGASLKPAKRTYANWFNTCHLVTSYDPVTNNPIETRTGCTSDSEPIEWVALGTYDKKTTPFFIKQLRSPSTPLASTINLSIYKTFPIRESYKFTFRAEAYNVLNSPSYGGQSAVNTSISQTSTFGTVTTTAAQNDPRIMQFSMKLSF
jgi:hypothetical protein